VGVVGPCYTRVTEMFVCVPMSAALGEDGSMSGQLTQEELEQLEAELLPRREALWVIGPLPAGTPGGDAARASADRGRRDPPGRIARIERGTNLAGRGHGQLAASRLNVAAAGQPDGRLQGCAVEHVLERRNRLP
jgi:hypothetical protein